MSNNNRKRFLEYMRNIENMCSEICEDIEEAEWGSIANRTVTDDELEYLRVMHNLCEVCWLLIPEFEFKAKHGFWNEDEINRNTSLLGDIQKFVKKVWGIYA